MNRITFYSLLGFLFITTFLNAQSSFLTTDSSTTYGIKGLQDYGRLNYNYCHLKSGDSVKKYSPYEIKEYGLDNGLVFIARDIQIESTVQRVFVRRLLKGNTTLYYYNAKGSNTYFFEKSNTQMHELPKNKSDQNGSGYKSKLNELSSECPEIIPAVEITGYRKRSLTNFFDVYNHCEIRPLPYIKYGISFAYGMIRMVKPPLHEDMLIPTPTWRVFLDQMDYKYNSSYTIGLFLDNPIFRKNYSIHTELNYTYIKSAFSQNINGNGIELAIDYSSLSIPLMVRYTLPYRKIQPFINGGAHYSVFLTNTSSYLINGTLIGNNLLMARSSIGYSLGSGLEYRLKYSKSLFFEFRYTKLYGISKSESFRRSELQLFTGINF